VDAPVVSRPEAVLESLREATPAPGRSTLFIGDGARAHADVIRDMLGERARIAEPPAPPLAGAIAIIAGELSISGEHAPHAIRPLYIRRTDAELARDARALR